MDCDSSGLTLFLFIAVLSEKENGHDLLDDVLDGIGCAVHLPGECLRRSAARNLDRWRLNKYYTPRPCHASIEKRALHQIHHGVRLKIGAYRAEKSVRYWIKPSILFQKAKQGFARHLKKMGSE